MRLKDKIALITGAGAGIGEATALLFADQGAKVIVSDRDYDNAKKVAEKIGANAFAVAADVAKSAEVEVMVKAGVEHFGGLDILVNNAGFGTLGTVVSLEEDLLDSVIDVNLKGVFLCSKFAIPELIRRGGGSIVNLASTISVVGIPDRAAYVAAKGGVAALTRAKALDHANEGIRVNSVAPGVINSSYYDKLFKEVEDPAAFKKGLEARSPLNKMGEPIDIANMILFLASDESTFSTGAMFTIDGGYTAR
ncbi:SDR family oxidoreductase [Acinetobacter bereziniae]|uniref:SDR family oxidoreductase n=1 Tax=Acinetobacter bereziniae TaxID=106648 RepID=UPI0015802B8A|nr:SDR family oxidoreductase [Acinetobacter bereziniae]NUF65430.1 SDR family oxidoreductase [Acinetobacter bereziniae]NUG09252.1 SDR family oxidoreductase [Acinetobacter bereziniae]NUG65855.1 SDR family oxidoreductase [Acinetobacter bereziniae]NUG71672.1 SDR family oxidoreductase [Acinetobacter bereziniae]NUG81396.1 SDR family oxidoreductase [Acinetobacter bereziniae]